MLSVGFSPGDSPEHFIRRLRVEDQEYCADIHLHTRFNAWQQREQDEPSTLPAAQLQALGQALAQLLLGDEGLRTLQSYRRQRRACPIVIEESPETSRCSQVAWELLHDGEDFIAIDPRTPIVRRRAGMEPVAEIRWQQPLKMLIFWASPADAAEIAIEDTQIRIAQALAPTVAARRLEVFELYHCSREQLRDALNGEHYDILCYNGHGILSADGETRLCLQNAQGQRQDLAPQDFKRLLNGMAQPPALVFLNCCYSAAGQGARLNDYARRLQDDSVPWVIATSTRVYVAASQTFVQRLFALLGEQAEPRIAQAVALARTEVLQESAADAPEQAQSFYRYLLFDNSAAEVRVSLSPRPAAPVGEIAAVSERLPGNLHAMVPRNWAAKGVEDLWRDGHACVGLYGLGGLGKTTLAALLAHHALNHPLPQLHAALVLWLDLEQTRDGPALLQQLAEVLRSRGFDTTAQWLCELQDFSTPVIGQRLRQDLGAGVLLVLDNAESLLDEQQRIADPAARSLLLALTAHAADWRSLITSRVRFDFSEAGRNPAPIHWQQLAPMRPMERAVLLERLLHSRSDLRLPPEQRFEVLQRIADTPWALNLFIGHLQADDDVAQRLDWALQKHGDYAGLAYYLERLSPAQRGVLQLLALLDESLPTADFVALYPVVRQAVAELPEADPAAHLPELQQRALLYRDESGHYDTYPTLRAYLQQQQSGGFSPDACQATHRAMAVFFYQASDTAGQTAQQRLSSDPQDTTAPDWYARQLHLLHRALRHALLQDDLSLMAGFLEEMATIQAGRLPAALLLAYAQHLQAIIPEKSPHTTLPLMVVATVYERLHQFKSAIDVFERARRLAESDQPDQVGGILHNLGMVFESLSDWPQAERYYREAIAWKEKTGHLQALGGSYHQLGRVFEGQQNWQQAERCYLAAIKWYEKNDGLNELGGTYLHLGMVSAAQRDKRSAEHYYHTAIACINEAKQFQQLGSGYHQLGVLFQAQRDWPQAERHYREAIDWKERTCQRCQLGSSFCQMGLLYLEQQQTEAACRWLARGVAAFCAHAPENQEMIEQAWSVLTQTLAQLEPAARASLWDELCQSYPVLAQLRSAED